MSSAKRTSNLTALAAIGVSLPLLYSLRHVSLSSFSIWDFFLQSDLGNAIAALVAVGGYMIEHWNSRRTQRLEAQIQRVQSQSKELLVPLTTHMQALCMGSLVQFVDSHFDDAKEFIVSEYGDVNIGQTILKQLSARPFFDVPTDHLHQESYPLWMLDVLSTEAVKSGPDRQFTSAIFSSIELPKFLHKAIQTCEKPTSKLWKSYEAFVRCELLPGVDRIAEIIDQSGHLMEPVPHKRLIEMYGREGNGVGQKWAISPRMFFYSMWLAYARSWHTLLQKWDSGSYDNIRPCALFPCGLLFFNIEAQTIVAQVEKELIGMSQMHGSVV
jgi:hypothetical protein